MASITIRKLDDTLKAKLRLRAARHGRSMEQEVREILKRALATHTSRSVNIADAIRRPIHPLGGVELRLPERQSVRRPPKLTT